MNTKRFRFALVGLPAFLFLVPALFAQSVALTPVDRQDKWWGERHVANVAQMEKGDIDLLMIGDSITHNWDKADKGRKVWDSYYGHRKAINLGFSGDRTEHLLWRLEHLPLTRINPKAAVLMIGTNNVGHKSTSPKEAADGIKAIVEKLEKQYPTMKILVLHVFPRDEKPDGALRKAVDEINSYLPELLQGKENVTLLDINPVFLDENKNLPKSIMADRLHPDRYGYELWAKAMEPTLTQMLGEENPATKPVGKMHEDWWKKRHEANAAQMEQSKPIGLLMLGDSITHGWDNEPAILDNHFGPFNPINLGFNSDQTQHVLWRLDHLPLTSIKPKVAMLMIGTNNTNVRANTPWMIAQGVSAVVDKLQTTYPDIQVIVLEIFPRGRNKDDWRRHRVSEINLVLRDLLKDRKNVELVNIGPLFMDKEGNLPKEIMPDFLHLSDQGYEIWGKTLAPMVKKKFGRQ